MILVVYLCIFGIRKSKVIFIFVVFIDKRYLCYVLNINLNKYINDIE